jgi:hypothetical protein
MEQLNEDGLTPDQVKMLTLQFMGQHLTGDLKVLDQNIVAKNTTLQGMSLNPTAVLNSIPAVVAPVAQPSGPQLSTNFVNTQSVIQQPVSTSTTNAVPAVVSTQQPVDPNQLEFSFETSPLSERIFESLERIEKKLSAIENRLDALEDIKKKG